MNTLNIETLHLKSGAHNSINQGACIMEAVSMLAGEEWSDHPTCACPVISAFLRSFNDGVNDEQRQDLKKYIPLLIGSRSTPEIERRRSMLAVDWVIRTYTPTWLRLAKFLEEAKAISDLSEIKSDEDVKNSQNVLSAAESAAKSAAKSAAWSAAKSAAKSAAESAAWSAAKSAAWSAAWSAAESAAKSAAWSAAWSAAESAAESAAKSAAESAAKSAAWSAAESALQPTMDELTTSALDLLNRMLMIK